VKESPRNAMRALDEPPPILGSWRRIYIVVLVYLAFLIATFYVFTRVFES
jgi:hypothetical protein